MKVVKLSYGKTRLMNCIKVENENNVITSIFFECNQFILTKF